MTDTTISTIELPAPVKMKKEEFNDEARKLVSVLRMLECSEVEDNSLVRWEVEDRGSDVFLVHPTVLRPLAPRAGVSARSSIVAEIEIDDLEEEACGIDDAVFTTTTSVSEWAFSIVYSETWCVPVLYFHVQNSDGSTMSRSEMLNLIEYTDSASASWDFISEEEHPVTGVPSLFLHPCQTAARMELLQSSTLYQESSKHELKLLCWMAMVFPALKFRISPRQYALLNAKVKIT
mmetsp:Transcript_16484/g.47401  ORF Transcript_16484/g.47401 Transcript_16484/m.47401 type:complete len:234 (-) Transcript_16484:1536-2237(-)|eukprot:CAMPEP_0113542974 /NCGR_PEP_ID=MMETSP0015_2-20120614/9908_1 /TAXON_ID=2838 /ORGANISM="Odontella" /LENGTH=233 /DNA_ID=CAMNT_0000443097 /DNA_START=386 /DNA_END=1087 /DNA_ORIENTATION=- /assembly_acc=CAM_ASM_000160